MSRKPENTFIAAINKPLPKALHRQRNVGSMFGTSGVPDSYYDGYGSDLWVEYKVNPSLPRNGIVIGKYTPKQIEWMTRRYEHSLGLALRLDSQSLGDGTNVVGIVGLPGGIACIQRTPEEWINGTHVSTAIPRAEVSHWIREFCGV